MTERDAATSPLARPGGERRREVSGATALGADAGKEEDGAREQLPRLGHLARIGRTDDGADGREAGPADEVVAPVVDEPRNVLPQQRPVGETHVLDVAAARVRGLDEAEEPGSAAPARREERLERVAAEVRVGGDRVGERRLTVTRLDEGGRVGARGRADVPALGVGDHEQAGGAGVVAHLGVAPAPPAGRSPRRTPTAA